MGSDVCELLQMSIESSSSPQTNPGESLPPRCVFLTGPRGAGMTRWLHQYVHRLVKQQPAVRCAVLLAEEGANGVELFAAASARVTVRKVYLSCLCCPWVADLPSAARALVAASRADWLFIVTPAIAAAALLAELDRVVCWPRRVVVCLDQAWVRARRQDCLSPFQFNLLNLADTVVAGPPLEECVIDAVISPALVPVAQPHRTRKPASDLRTSSTYLCLS